MILGIALHASGLSFYILFIVVLYFVFKHWQPLAGFSLLTVTSIFVGMAFSKVYYLLIWHPEKYSMLGFVEPVIVAFAAGALLFTRKRWVAWVLIVYSTVTVLFFLLGAVYHFPRATNLPAWFFAATFGFIQLWLLSTWLRSQPQVVTLRDTTPHE